MIWVLPTYHRRSQAVLLGHRSSRASSRFGTLRIIDWWMTQTTSEIHCALKVWSARVDWAVVAPRISISLSRSNVQNARSDHSGMPHKHFFFLPVFHKMMISLNSQTWSKKIMSTNKVPTAVWSLVLCSQFQLHVFRRLNGWRYLIGLPLFRPDRLSSTPARILNQTIWKLSRE